MSDENDFVEENEENVEVENDQMEDSEGSSDVDAESLDELQEELEVAAENGASKEELKSMIKTYELKYKDKTVHRKLDLNDHDAVQRELQKAYAGQISMQEKAELENALKSQIQDWKNNPWKFFEQMNLDPDELAEMRIQQKIDEMKKDPLELEREKMQAELQKMREELNQKQEREKQLQMERMQEQAAMELDEEISSALDAHGSLPASPRVVKQIADTMLWAMDNGFKDVKASDVIDTVEAEIRKEIADLMESLPEQAMEEYIGKKNLERLRKQRINNAKKVPKTASSINKNPTVSPKKDIVKENKPKKSIEDYLRRR